MNKQPTFAELEILGILWQKKQATVREVFEIVSKERKVAYTTILKTMQIMFEKDFVERDTSAKSHRFKAKLYREKVIAELLGKVFRGSTKDLVGAIITAKQTSSEEIKEIRKALKSKKSGRLKGEKVIHNLLIKKDDK
jgi:predicted transcriptional regulator